MKLISTSALMLLVAPLLGAQQVATTRLPAPSAKYPEPFTQVSGVRELSDGRVIVADPRERTLQLLDFRTGTATPIGREGQGPEEWRLPAEVFALPGDSTLVFDIGNLRYFVVGPDGKPAYTFSLAGGEGARVRTGGGGGGGAGAAGGLMVGGMLRAPGGVDRQGRFYFASPPVRMGPDGPEAVDSVEVTRLERGSGRVDTVARVHVPGTQVAGGQEGGNRVRMMVRMGSPFEARDEWAVSPDGRVALVRHSPFRVEWVAPAGTVTRGPVQPYTPLRVTDADKAAAREAQQRGGGMRVAVGPGGTQVTMGPPPSDAPPSAADDGQAWPDVKPPFVGGAARVAPNGHLWLLRTRDARDPVPVHDVYDGSGRLTRRVALPRDTRLVGFGARSVYVIRMDEDDLQYLERIDAGELLGG